MRRMSQSWPAFVVIIMLSVVALIMVQEVICARKRSDIDFAELLSDYDAETSNLIDDENYNNNSNNEDSDVYSESNNDQHAQHLKLQLELLQRQQQLRQGSLDIFVEVLLVTDHSIFEMHKSIILSSKWNLTHLDDELVENHIRAYYTQIIDDVNLRYKRSFQDDPSLNITVVISGFHISKEPSQSPWSELKYFRKGVNKQSNPVIDGDLVLVYFNEWIEKKRQEFASFDHAFGITAYDLFSNDKKIDYNGLAFVYGICKNSFSGSLIEERGAFSSSRSFAHELAHNLGAKHDGVEENNCSSWDNYLMSPIFLPYNQNNSWVFSKCSKNMIKKYLTNPENNYCLLNRPETQAKSASLLLDEPSPSENKLFPGQIYDATDQCRQLHGAESVPCFQYQRSFCESLFCQKSREERECLWIAPAAEGTQCDDEKWCMQGQCVVKPASEPDESTCENDSIMWLGELNAEEQAYLNLDSPDELTADHRNFNFTCEYGIKILMKVTNKDFQQVCSDWLDVCCKTCQGYSSSSRKSQKSSFNIF